MTVPFLERKGSLHDHNTTYYIYRVPEARAVTFDRTEKQFKVTGDPSREKYTDHTGVIHWRIRRVGRVPHECARATVKSTYIYTENS